jgi:GNAT superfamily N-acetyltransferase
MQIVPAELPDLTACYKMTAHYTTDYVWQLQTLNSGTRTDIRFDRVRLPRPMQVEYPRSPDELLDHWEANGCFFVARNSQEAVTGYLDAEPLPWENILWVRNLVVDRPFRRQKTGSALLRVARQWAIKHNLTQIMLEMQTKNWPAIAFAQKHGFAFCGFNERYYTNGDITLYFYHNL